MRFLKQQAAEESASAQMSFVSALPIVSRSQRQFLRAERHWSSLQNSDASVSEALSRARLYLNDALLKLKEACGQLEAVERRASKPIE